LTARSYLFVPADQPDKLGNASRRQADAVIADLEDGVAPSAKTEARRAAAGWLADRSRGELPSVWVRVNPGKSLTKDIHATVLPALSGICLPKVRSPQQVQAVDGLLGQAEARCGMPPGSIKLLALVESAAGVLAAQAIAQEPRVVRLGLGELDLCAELGIEPSEDEHELIGVRTQVVLASAAAGLDPPVAPLATDVRDLEALRHSTEALRRIGFGARWAIHPAQVPVINRVFTPSQEAVEAARRLIGRFEATLATGRGVLLDDGGRIIDEAVVKSARRTLAQAAAAEATRARG
jgi:citrate lyase subunit beta/citryl-CoA lyase